ncbi:MAG: hypothetical protein ACREJU_01650 [Nitrospiraceae bacterium]
MSSAGWNAIAALGTLAFVAATFLATSVALFLGVWPIYREQRCRREQGSLVRSQLLAHLKVIRESICPRSHPLDLLQREAYEPLQCLWIQAHLLELDEWRLLHRSTALLLVLRNRPTLNQRETRMAQDLIDQTCMALERYDLALCSEQLKPSLTESLLAYVQTRWVSRQGSLRKRIEPA